VMKECKRMRKRYQTRSDCIVIDKQGLHHQDADRFAEFESKS
jgi:hypothetical protein